MDFRYSATKQALYQPVINCTYWPVPVPYNTWTIIDITPKSIPSEAFDEINQVVLDRIIKNMDSLVQSSVYGVINTNDNTSNLFYVIQFISESYTLQNNTTIDGQLIYSDELVFKAQYFFSMQENTDWYWKQQPLQQTVIVPTCTILHPRLDAIIIRYVQDIPKDICNSILAKNIYKDIQLL